MLVMITVAVILLGAVMVPYMDSETQKDEDVLDVIVLGGQSNMAYIPAYMDIDVVNEELGEPSMTCYYFGTDTRPSYLGMDMSECDMHSMYNNGAWIIGGEECGLAYTLASRSHHDILTINVAIPAYTIAQFEPGTTGGNHIKNTIEAALSVIPSTYTINKVGWAWCQGESDKKTSYSSYISSFDKIDAMMNEYGFDKCYLVQTKPVDSGSATIAQEMIVQNEKDVVMASTAPATFTVANGNLIEGNSLHYSQQGRIIVGEDIANAVTIPDDSYYSLLYVIPVMVIAAIILIAVRMIYSNRD